LTPGPATDPIAELLATVEDAAAALAGGEREGARPSLERPKQADHGDYSSNAAMLLAPVLGGNPREIAEKLAAEVSGRLGERLEKVEVAGPGFLNLYLADGWFGGAFDAAAGDGGLAAPTTETKERIHVEFVSANPTGPLTAAGGRHASYGDALASILTACGNGIEREYYINDIGGQTDRFAASIAARMTGQPVPQEGYEGDYVIELAERLQGEGVDPTDLATLGVRGPELMIESIRGTLERFGVEFDTWFSERTLHADGEVKATLADLREKGHAYDSDGAVWLRTTDFGDDKDRVLVRSGGEPTYYLADIAYHRGKFERGFDRLINVVGADHHGYVARIKASMEALGYDPERLEMVIMQLVHVVEGGERSQMSKRKGEFVTLDELIDDIGTDAARYWMLQRSHDTTVDLDLDLARKQSNENPVYYVQYAHARIAGILRKAEAESGGDEAGSTTTPRTSPFEPAERDLIKRLLEMPGEVGEAAARRAPHRLCTYASEVASDFHAFYRDCQVVGAEGEGVEASRLELCGLTKHTIADTLGLLGISAPESM
jgi:arginyl-tRNA synthetase